MALARALDDLARATPLAAAARAAQRLSARLTDPVRVAVVGRPGAGKSTLCTFLDPTLAPTPAPTAGLALTEVTLAPDATADMQGIDIVILCGPAFGKEERRLWERLHPAQRDHAVFALAGADRLALAGRLSDSLATLDAAAGDLLLGLFPLATPQAIAARRANDGAALAASGGAALLRTVDRLVAEGRDAARGAARLFLARHAPGLVAPGPVVPAPGVAGMPAPQRPPPEGHTAGMPVPDPPLPGAGEPAAMRPAPAAPAAPPWQAAHDLLAAGTGGWAALAGLPAPDRARAILDRACALASAVADLAPTGISGPLAEETATVADMVQLMRAEGGAAAATDALTLLWQLRASLAAAAASVGSDAMQGGLHERA